MPSFYDNSDNIFPDNINDNITGALENAITDDETPTPKKKGDPKETAAQERSMGQAISDDFGSSIKATDDRYLKLKAVQNLNFMGIEGNVSIKTLEDRLVMIQQAKEDLISQGKNVPTTGTSTPKSFFNPETGETKIRPARKDKAGNLYKRVDNLSPQLVEGLNYLDKESKLVEEALQSIYEFENTERIANQGLKGKVFPAADRIMKPDDIQLAGRELKKRPGDVVATTDLTTPNINESLIANFDAELSVDKIDKISIKNAGTRYASTKKIEKDQTVKELKRELQYGLETAGTLDSGKAAVVTSEVMENKPQGVIQTPVHKMKPTRAKYAQGEIVYDLEGVSQSDDFSFGSLKNEASEIEEDAAAIKRKRNINPPVDIGQNKLFSEYGSLMRNAAGEIVPWHAGHMDEAGKFIRNKKLEFKDVMPHEIKKYGITPAQGLKKSIYAESKKLQMDLPEYKGPLNPDDVIATMDYATKKDGTYIEFKEKTGVIKLNKEKKKILVEKTEIVNVPGKSNTKAIAETFAEVSGPYALKGGGKIPNLPIGTPMVMGDTTTAQKQTVLVQEEIERTRNIVGSKHKLGYQDLLLSGHELQAKSIGGKFGDSTALPYVSESRFKNYLANRNITMSQTGGQSMNKTLRTLTDKSAESLFNAPYVNPKTNKKSLGYYGITKGDVYKALETEAVQIENIRKSVIDSITPKGINNPAYVDTDLDATKEYDKLAGTKKGRKTGTFNIPAQENLNFRGQPNRGTLEVELRKNNNIVGDLNDYGIEHPKVLKELAPVDKKYLFETEKVRKSTGQGIEKSLGIPDTGGFQHLFKQSDFTNKVKEFEKSLVYDAYTKSLKGNSPRLPITTDTDVILKNITPEQFVKSMNFATKGMSGIEISKDTDFSNIKNQKSLVRQIAASQFATTAEGSKFGDVEKGIKFVDELKKTFKLISKER